MNSATYQHYSKHDWLYIKAFQSSSTVCGTKGNQVKTMNSSKLIMYKHGSTKQLGRIGSKLRKEQHVNKTETAVSIIPSLHSSISLLKCWVPHTF